VLFLHAHPDDETLATGALIVDLAERGVDVAVLTATRGERGEVRDEVAGEGVDLVALRERELAGALSVLGVHRHGFLGQPPARAAGLPPRRYTDSGMAWLAPGQAGPGAGAGPDALTAADVDAAAADVAGYVEWFGADVLMSYDEGGGYGHPDHVACHWIGLAAARLAGVGFVEVVSDPEPEGVPVLPLDGHLETVRAALQRYRSQLAVAGDDVVHVGGQRHRIGTDVALRDVPVGWHA
jgi:N-acetyl-1-D-myo-inositol-2-amino-2-deoxy-alpha-D-glucopyranoside deacetylase